MTTAYEPREDSYLLAHQVRKYARGNVLDLGTGTGIQAREAANKKTVTHVAAIDLNPEAIAYAKKHSHVNHKIEFFTGDLFEPVKKCRIKQFDTIIFNPPYLPADHGVKDVALHGGKHGWETLERALNAVNDYLAPNGRMLIVFSSLTNKEKVDAIITKNLLMFKLLNTINLFYEKLYVYLIQKSAVARALDNKGVQHLTFLARGTRKLVYKARLGRKQVVVKVKRPDSTANPIPREVKMLKLLSAKKLSARVLSQGKDYFITEYVSGQFLKDWIKIATPQEVKWLLQKVFDWCYQMDKLNISKEEMHRPWKHVLINGKKIGMIDFERAHHTNDPKNVSQFVQFVMNYAKILKGITVNRVKMIEKTKEYKKTFEKKEFAKILKELNL
ncbi:methyltransferase [Candidatus Woesearchaeota archaeon]|nr:methyltransferase [Candidatus Woesearchaeota archaeon]